MLKSSRIITLAVCAAVLPLTELWGAAPSQTIAPLRAPRPVEDEKDSAHEVRAGKKPVTAILKLPQRKFQPGDQIELNVTLKIAPLWEVHTFDAKPDMVATKLKLGLPEGITAEGDWKHPKPGRSLAPDGHPSFAGTVTFTRTLKVSGKMPAGDTAIECEVHFQACNETRCLRPEDLKLTLPIEIRK
jgi:hypothetical protein